MPTHPYKNELNKRIPGVTTVGGNLGWKTRGLCWYFWDKGKRGKDFDDTTEADDGSRGHYLIECWIKKTEPDKSKFPPEVWKPAETCFDNFLQWKESVHFQLLESELSLISEQNQCGATIDCIASIMGKKCLFDWKTGKGLTVYPDHLVQIEAYRHIYDENFPNEKIDGGLHLLRIAKENASHALYYWEEIPEAWETFLLARQLHELKKKIEERI